MGSPTKRSQTLASQAREQRLGLHRTHEDLRRQWVMVRDQRAALDTLRADVLRQDDKARVGSAHAKHDAFVRKARGRGYWESKRK